MPSPVFSSTVRLDLADVVPSIAGPARPQDRIALDAAKTAFRVALPASLPSLAQLSAASSPDSPAATL